MSFKKRKEDTLEKKHFVEKPGNGFPLKKTLCGKKQFSFLRRGKKIV